MEHKIEIQIVFTLPHTLNIGENKWVKCMKGEISHYYPRATHIKNVFEDFLERKHFLLCILGNHENMECVFICKRIFQSWLTHTSPWHHRIQKEIMKTISPGTPYFTDFPILYICIHAHSINNTTKSSKACIIIGYRKYAEHS